MDRQSAQQRVDRIAAFREELAELKRAGILLLTAEQEAAVEQHHRAVLSELSRSFDVDMSEGTAKLSLAMKIASALGGLAFCLALGSLVQRYWALLDTWLQVTLLICAPLAAAGLAEFASKRERTLYFTSLLCLVGLAAFYVDLTTLGEIFSLTPSPAAVAAWSALALLFAYRYRLRLQLLIGLSLLVPLVPMLLLFMGGYEWMDPFVRLEILILAGVPLGWVAIRERSEFAPVMRGVAAATILIAVIMLSKSGYGSFLPLGRKPVEGLYTLLSFGCCGTGIALGIRHRWEEIMFLSSICFGGFLISKMYDWLWELVPAFVFFTLIGVLSLTLLYAFRRFRESMRGGAA